MTRSFLTTLALLPLTLFALNSCKSSTKKGIPKNLPNIKISSSAAPPKHNMNRGEYPFDERGNYVAAWAAEGSRGGGNIPAPQIESPIELPTPEPERKSKSRSSRMIVSSAPPPAPPPPQVLTPPSRPTPTPTLRNTPPPPVRPTPTVTSSSSSTPRPSTSTPSSATQPKPTPKPKPKTPTKPTSSTLTYTVKSGDTLYALALRYKSTVAKIKSASGISSDKLKIGQKLRIPR